MASSRRRKLCASSGGSRDFRSKYRTTLSDFPLAGEFTCGNRIRVMDSSAYHLASPAHWPRCRLKAATKLNNSSSLASSCGGSGSLAPPVSSLTRQPGTNMARSTYGFHQQQVGNSQQIDPGPPAPVTRVDAGRPAASLAPEFPDPGLTFNAATPALEGRLWQNSVQEDGQGLGSGAPRSIPIIQFGRWRSPPTAYGDNGMWG